MGGVENYTYHLAKELVRRGNSVTIVTCNVENVRSYEKCEGIIIYRVPCLNFIDGRFPVPKFNRDSKKIHRMISGCSYDMVIVNTRFYIHSLYGVIFGKKSKCRTILIEHGTGHLTLHNKFLDFIENIVEHTMTFFEKKMCKEFYGVSGACLEWLRHFHIEGKGVLYNAIDLEEINRQLNAPVCSYRKKYHIPEDGEIVAFTGRLLKEKGIVTLVKAFGEITKKDLGKYLFVAGDGDEYTTIEKMKNDHVILLGRIRAEEVTALLRESDVFCLPSDSEGMPTSVLEAAACKNYIVTTERGGAKELVLDKSYGIIIKDNDLITVKEALEKAFSDPDIRLKGVEKTYHRLETYFTWEKIAERIIGL